MPNIRKFIFNRKNLQFQTCKIEKKSIPDLNHKLEIIERWANLVRNGSINKLKETSLQGFFLKEIFSEVLGYQTATGDSKIWNLNQEQVTDSGKFADGSLGFFTENLTDVRAVIELKDATTNLDEKQHKLNDIHTPVEQAFGYQHQVGKKCNWVIVSNFKEIRLYHHKSSSEYEVFNIAELTEWENFRIFWFLLSYENLINPTGTSEIDTLFEKNEADELQISKELYSTYKKIRIKLFEHLKQYNPDKPELMLLEKSQKLLDRFIFISFCEDNHLLPDKVLKKIIASGKSSFQSSNTKIWNELKGLFEAINLGSPPHNINKFNGGLFATDFELNNLEIRDGILEELSKLSEYDYESDVDVNILGHIFEQSISDIEELKAGIEKKDYDKSKSKRKKEGIYYTPEFITKYIVENAVGGWLEDRKKELGFYGLPEIDLTPALSTGEGEGMVDRDEYINSLPEDWERLKPHARENRKNPTNAEKLMWAELRGYKLGFKFRRQHSIGQYIVDFVCLEKKIVVELDGEIHEQQKEYDELRTKYIEDQGFKVIRFKNQDAIDNTAKTLEIIKNELDNRKPESIDSLPKWGGPGWGHKEDPGWGPEKPVKSSKELKYARQKHLEFWLAYREKLSNIKVLDPACGSGAFLNQAFNFLYAEGQKVNEKITELSGGQHEIFQIDKHILTNNLYGVDLNQESVEITKLSLWIKTANKYSELTALDDNIKCGNSLIDDPAVAGDKAFNWFKEFPEVFPGYRDYSPKYLVPGYEVKTIEEIRQRKLQEPEAEYLGTSTYEPMVIQEPSYSYKAGSKGFERHGFDVVIGNPPYVDIKALDNKVVKYLFRKFTSTENRINLYSVFVEKGINLLRNGGYNSFIIPNSILFNSSYYKIRKQIIGGLVKIIKLPDTIFEEAKVETIIYCYKKGSDIPEIKYINYPFNKTISIINDDEIMVQEKHHWLRDRNLNFNIFFNNKVNNILNKVERNCTKLIELADFTSGITPYDKYKGHTEEIIKGREFHSKKKLSDTYKPLVSGENISRYFISNKVTEYINYGVWLGAPREERFFIEPRIIVRQIVSGNPLRIYAGFTDEPLYYTQIGFGVIPKDNSIQIKYLLCLLNSYLLNKYHKYRFLDQEKELFQKVLIANCKLFPIQIIPLESQLPFIALADTMLEKNKELQLVKNTFIDMLKSEFCIEKLSTKLQNWMDISWSDFLAEMKKLKIELSGNTKEDWFDRFNRLGAKAREIKQIIDNTDKEIDKMVYELYGLNEEEIKIVEGEE